MLLAAKNVHVAIVMYVATVTCQLYSRSTSSVDAVGSCRASCIERCPPFRVKLKALFQG